ncbi:MAG: hypothetical protein J6W79_02120 [Alphaproteobacteria bacterium]|nr:hypothetical protein [Alphaproteobacteria bacterium]
MAKTNENMDPTINKAFGLIAKTLASKIERKKPITADKKDYRWTDYKNLKKAFVFLNNYIVVDPADYFVNYYNPSVFGATLELCRMTQYRGGRLLEDLMIEAHKYYNSKKPTNGKDIASLYKRISLWAADGMIQTLSVALTPVSKFVEHEKQK